MSLKNSLIKVISLLLISSVVLADTQVTYLPKGSTTGYDGYLFTVPKAEELRNTTIERDGYKLLNESLQKSLDLQKGITDLNEQKVNKLLDQNDKLATALNDARTTSEWTKVFWFTLGIVLTGTAVYGATRLQK